jgi:succinate dehydrogenase / fumarate reductase iron-sulfur subunit
MRLTLHVWRQAGPNESGRIERYEVNELSPQMSFLEMLDVVNERFTEEGKDPITFDHDCREGICGACGMMIDGVAHGPQPGTTTCQLRLRHFNDGDEIRVEPWRAAAFPVLKDLMVDRSALDRVIEAGGYISIDTGAAPDANEIPIPKADAERALDAAACIGCGACVAQCPNGAAQLFTAAKITHLGLLPQGQRERYSRVESMMEQMQAEAFGGCTDHWQCGVVCPKEISVDYIARLNSDYSLIQLARRGAASA